MLQTGIIIFGKGIDFGDQNIWWKKFEFWGLKLGSQTPNLKLLPKQAFVLLIRSQLILSGQHTGHLKKASGYFGKLARWSQMLNSAIVCGLNLKNCSKKLLKKIVCFRNANYIHRWLVTIHSLKKLNIASLTRWYLL